METLQKLIFILTPRERKIAFLLLVMILIMALLDVLGVASVLPFISILANPEIIDSNHFLNRIYKMSYFLGVGTKNEFLFVMGIFIFLLLVLTLSFKALTIYVQIRFSAMREYSISKRLVEGYLRQPYSWFLNENSADLGKTILSEVGAVIHNGVKAMIDLITYSAVTLLLVILLIFVDPKISLIAGLVLGSAYLALYRYTRNYLKQIGKERLEANEKRFTILNEAFGAAKEIKASGLEKEYTQRFSVPAQTLARHTASYQILGRLPRFIIEAIAFGGLVLMTLYLMSNSGTFTSTIPIISVFAFAGYRLIPALQQIYVSFSALRYVGSSLDEVYNDIKNLNPYLKNFNGETLKLNKAINLENIHYSYPKSSKKILKNINLNIPAYSTVGLVGTTGSGKTTIVDIILGLFQAQQGTLKIDGISINNNNIRSWQRSVGYVPQNIFLADDTIASNIAFGVDPKNIELDKVIKASKIANINNFINNELPNKYDTIIGERGIRLSGGQRQRIGIARALYNQPQLLILDEATSALDGLTEKAVMDAVNNLSKNITIILIAHRLSTVKKCDKIFVLENGEIKKHGTFEELIKISDRFRMTADII